ncbi:MAG: TIGR02147 family protein [Deltaproteobacteria bacterium]|nr:TIGR02147 family protein [Deltaproteobacteria bacterium]
MKHRLHLFQYTSYRAFLRDLYAHKKETVRGFSHRVFVRLCGFTSPNFLKLVMDGQRDLGKSAQHKLIGALCNNKVEREYFAALIHFEQARSIEAKNQHLSTIARLCHKKQVRTMDVDQYAHLSHWHNVAIRELVTFEDFVEDVSYVNRKLCTQLTQKQLAMIIDQLLAIKILVRDSHGRLVQRDAHVVCAPEIFSVAVVNYHHAMLDKAKMAIAHTPHTHRDISGLTVSIDRQTFEQIKCAIQRCREEIHHIAAQTEKREVLYQVNFQLFNLSEVV